jgi:small subunit ribosomal protein S11
MYIYIYVCTSIASSRRRLNQSVDQSLAFTIPKHLTTGPEAAGLNYFRARSEIPVIRPNILHVKATFNNTLITVTNDQGNVIAWSSGGGAGFKKANRAGYEPAYQATKLALNKVKTKLGDIIKQNGMHVKLKGFGPGRDAAWKCVLAEGWKVQTVEDVTPIAHGGCRPRKARRL